MTGRSPSGRATHERSRVAPSPPTVGIPNAVGNLRENAESLKQYMDSFYEAKREQHDSMFGRPYGIEERVTDLLTLVQRLTVSVYQGLQAAASAIEARSDATPKSGAAEGESAGPKDDAQ